MVDEDDLIEIFEEGMRAHVVNLGHGRWLNPYTHLLSEANPNQKALDEIYRKVNAWDAGWLCQERKEAEKAESSGNRKT